jgi:type II secretory pathway predicted ATPase ExeA
MDEETKAYLDAMMAQINNQFERVLDQMATLQTDFQNTKGFLLEDAIVLGRRALTIERRLTDLEKKKG